MKTVARALVSSHIWPTEGQIWGTLVGGAETSPHAGDHKLVHPSLNLPKASHLLEMTNLFAHLDECGAPEEGIRKGFARLLTQVRKLANLGHPYGVATTSAVASVHCFVNLPQQVVGLIISQPLKLRAQKHRGLRPRPPPP